MPRNITLSEAIVQYESHLRARNLAANSIKNSTQVLGRAERTWGPMFVASIRPVHIDRLFSENNWSPSTRNLYLGNLRQFFQWARHHGYMQRDFDPTFGWRNQRVPNQEKLRIPIDQFYDLMDAVEHPRDRAVIALGLFTFLRGSELQHLRVGDLDLGNSALEVYRVKTKDYDTLPVCDELREEMVAYLNWYRANQGQLVGNWFLVPAKNPDRWTWRDGALTRLDELADLRPTARISHPYRVAQRALNRLGYDIKGEGEHTLRRSGARALFDSLRDQGVDGALMRVSSMLGHRDVKVTQVYIGLNTERAQRNATLAGQRMFPGLNRERATLRVVSGGE